MFWSYWVFDGHLQPIVLLLGAYQMKVDDNQGFDVILQNKLGV